MTEAIETAASSSDAIVDSIFDQISSSGQMYFDVTEHIQLTKMASSKNIDLEIESERSATKSVERNETKKESPTKRSRDRRPSKKDVSKDTVCVDSSKNQKEKKRTEIKIASLKESTKSQIVESSAAKDQQHGKSSEEGEILPSDIDSGGSQSEDDDANAMDETDGELESDKDEKREKKKKKKHKHGHRHHHRHKRDKKEKHRDDSRRERSKAKEPSAAVQDTKESNYYGSSSSGRRPWEKMLDFHLNLKQRRDDPNCRYHFDSRSSAQRHNDGSRAYSNSFRRGRSRSPLGFRTAHCPFPDRNVPGYLKSRTYDARSRSTVRTPSSVEYTSQRRYARIQSRSRSRLRSHSKERTPQPPPAVPEKSEKTPPVVEIVEDDQRIDKQRLYEIARRNAAAMFKSGALQQQINSMSVEDLMKLRSGGKSVEDLIAYCRKLQKKEEKREAGESSSDDDDPKDKGDEDELDAFIRHPFLLKPQTSSAFVFNVKNVIQLPVKTPAERAADDAKLRVTFPVSSGEQHRSNTELEWVPVSPPPSEKPLEKRKDQPSKAQNAGTILALPPPPSPPPVLPLIPPPPPPPALEQEPPMEQAPVDIGEAVNTRLKALRRLNENSNDVEAMKLLHFAEEQMKQWAASKNIPGLFTGSTGASCLTPEQLAPVDMRCHAWAKKDCLISAKPVTSGVGMQLMQKMGWRPGEGLGKNREGTLEPLLLEVKSDRKGLLASEEGPSQRLRAAGVNMKDFQGKHPVSALMELCSKRRWSLPDFSCVEAGPSHDRRFTWKAVVNGVEYQAATPTGNKKSGKAQVCQIVLQSLGLLPRDKSLPVIIG